MPRRKNNKYDKTDSVAVLTGQPCPMCPSSDAYTLYSDGHGYCFSCQGHTRNNDNDKLDTEAATCCSDPFLVRNQSSMGEIRYFCFHCEKYTPYKE